ncbi:phage tail protein [Paenibacillus tyrfis]|uniref:Tail collar protein n=1 Tax=Paenibacillus tyrfis TaxID=1501230 RepID=A0A081P7Z8_9BACL|nr:tail fiber protein [Paenibacillus tyrfis]KEQ26821.1 tail collar protein [Paenibacillus tyrfis]
MSESYLGEIRMFAGEYAPIGWAFCDGQLLSISENDTLFNLIGTTYGGDGLMTFALPDLRGRVPIHMEQQPGNSSYVLGQKEGVESVTLNKNQLPAHTHKAMAQSQQGTTDSPEGGYWANSTLTQFGGGTSSGTMNPGALAQSGGGQPHDNMMPFTTVSFIISLYGTYPNPN